MSLRQLKTTIIMRNRTKTYGAGALAVAVASVVGDRRAETNKVSDRLADPDAQENERMFNRLIVQEYIQ